MNLAGAGGDETDRRNHPYYAGWLRRDNLRAGVA